MKKGELLVTLNYEELTELFEKSEQYCEMCRYIHKKIKTRIDEAGVQSVWDGQERRNKIGEK